MRNNKLACFGIMILVVLSCASFGQAAITDALEGYWEFESYTPGTNPAGMPGGGNQGTFADSSPNGQLAYGAEFTSEDYVPWDETGGKFGGSFFSMNTGNNGALAVVPHNDNINFDEESFTISFWETVLFRDVAGSGWAAGRGRSQFFTKAPYIPPEDPNVTKEGFGLNLTQNHFDVLTNMDDNFGQSPLGAKYTYPTGSDPDDSGEWAHWMLTGTYNAGNDDYTMTVYLNGNAVDWNGAVGTTFTVPNDIIDNDGDLTIGSFFRNNGYATQRFISWNMSEDTQVDLGQGWLDDFAMFSVDFTSGEAMSTVNLGNEIDLAYSMNEVQELLEVHRNGTGSVKIEDATWSYASGLTGTDGQLTATASGFTLVIDGTAGTGLTGVNVYGDLNGDGDIDDADLNILLSDFSEDGVGTAYSQDNLDALLGNFGLTGLNDLSAGSVPEPSSLILLLFAALGLCAGRRRS